MFSSKKKLYFVFADEQDVFFTDSMLRLNTVDYLWLMLRKSGYQNVFQISSAQDAFDVEIMDTDAALIHVPGSKPLLGPREDGRALVLMEEAKLLKWLCRNRKKEKNGNTALIFQADALQKLFQYSPGPLAAFLDLMESSQITVVLRFPMCLSEKERMLFTSKKSVFARKNDRNICLSEPVYDLIHAEEAAVIFEKLKAELDDGLIQLGAFSYGRICTMLRWVALRLELDMSAEQYRDYANFLYWYVYSPNLRRFTKDPLEHVSNYRSLVECLLRHGAFDTIDERIAALKNEYPGMMLADILYKFCPLRKDEDRNWIQITHDNQQLLQIARLPFPVDIIRISSDQDATIYDRQRWLEMQQWVTKPHTQPVVPEQMKYVCAFQEIYRKSLSCGDGQTALRAARVLYDTAMNLYMPVGSRERIKAFELYLELSQAAYRLDKRIRPEGSRMTKQQLQCLMRTNPTISALVTLLLNYREMLNKMADAFLLPDVRFGRLLRDASELMKQPASEEPQEETPLTEEEEERLLQRFENVL